MAPMPRKKKNSDEIQYRAADQDNLSIVTLRRNAFGYLKAIPNLAHAQREQCEHPEQ
jgi:hypothetical protein